MKQMFMAIAACAALGGCASTQTMVWDRIDGRAVPLNSPEMAAFDSVKAICIGEMSKADLSAGSTTTGNIAIDLPNAIDRDQAKSKVMLGCMASHGYKLAPFKSAA